jgi:hypothetical protein
MLPINEYKKRAMEFSRERKLQHFYSLCKEGDTVLDVGVSAESKRALPALNYFLKNYRYASETYTGLGIQDLTGVRKLFPDKRFVEYPGGQFPFKDKEFDWVFSNAVIEHVGDDEAHLVFLSEMMRVSSNVFFTTPNKYFPIESHTNLLFLHWNDSLFYSWCKKYKPWFAKENLSLYSYMRLCNLMRTSKSTSYSIFKNRIMGIPMTFTVVCTDR